MPNFGFGALALGSGAAQGLQELLKQRLLERQMALQEQAQREDTDYRNRSLSDSEAWRRLAYEQKVAMDASLAADREADNQRQGYQQMVGQAKDLAQTYTKGQPVGDAQVGLLRATGMGHLAQPTEMPMPEGPGSMPGDTFMGAAFAGLPEKQPTPSGTPVKIRGAGGKPIYTTAEDAIGKEAWDDPGQGGAAMGLSLTPGGLDVAARQYAQTGQMPSLGMGNANMRSAIINRAAELFPDLDTAGAGAEYKSNLASLTQLTKRVGAIKPYAAQASLSLDNVMRASADVPRTGSPMVNRYKNWISKNLTGQAPLSRFEVFAYNAARDYARVSAGGAESVAQMTDAAAAAADALLNTAMNPEQLAEVVAAMKADMQNTTSTLEQQLAETKARIRQKPGEKSAPVEAPPPPASGERIRVIAPNGKSGTLPAGSQIPAGWKVVR